MASSVVDDDEVVGASNVDDDDVMGADGVPRSEAAVDDDREAVVEPPSATSDSVDDVVGWDAVEVTRAATAEVEVAGSVLAPGVVVTATVAWDVVLGVDVVVDPSEAADEEVATSAAGEMEDDVGASLDASEVEDDGDGLLV